MQLREINDELGTLKDTTSEEALVMGMDENGGIFSVKGIEAETHEDGSTTVWLKLEDY